MRLRDCNRRGFVSANEKSRETTGLPYGVYEVIEER